MCDSPKGGRNGEHLTSSAVGSVRGSGGHAMWSVCCLLLSLLAASDQLDITNFVVPSSVTEGSDVELKCEYTLDAGDRGEEPYVKWWFHPTYHKDDKPILIYQRVKPEEHYLYSDFKWSGSKDNVLLEDAKYSDSGRYMCEVSGYNEKRISAELVVYSNGTGPQLNITVVEDGPDADEVDDLLVQCHADDVTPEPELVISADGRELQGVAQEVTPNSSEPYNGLFSVTANVTVSKSDLEGAEVRCELFFVNSNISHLPFVDTETYSSTGAVAPAEPEPRPSNLTLNDPAPQTNRSTKSVNWWLSIAAGLVMVLQSMIQTSN